MTTTQRDVYTDPDLLEELYERCGGFPTTVHHVLENEYGVDVTKNTVRNQLEKHGIHEPWDGGSAPESNADEDAIDGLDGADGNGNDGILQRGDDETADLLKLEEKERESEPKVIPDKCACGVACDGLLEWTVHRTEAHGIKQRRLDYLEPGEFPEIVASSETVAEAADRLGWRSTRVLRVIGVYGIDDLLFGDGRIELSDLARCDVTEGSA
jgi:hypothetical protein